MQKIKETRSKISYNEKDNQDIVRKFDGYMKIYKKKLDNSNTNHKQYFESPLVKDIVRNKGIQFNGDMVEKVMKTYKIKDEYGTNIRSNFIEPIPDINQL